MGGITDSSLPGRIRQAKLPALRGELAARMKVHRAAVLIPLLLDEGEWRLLFEVRAYNLDMQPGDVCFPGGGIEEGETARETVLRETEEELLIPSSSVDILAELPELRGPGGLMITPFIGVLQGYACSFSKEETDHVFTVPLSYFVQQEPEIYRGYLEPVVSADFPHDKVGNTPVYPFRKIPNDMYLYDIPLELRRGAPRYDGTRKPPVLWGFTGKVVRLFVELYGDVF